MTDTNIPYCCETILNNIDYPPYSFFSYTRQIILQLMEDLPLIITNTNNSIICDIIKNNRKYKYYCTGLFYSLVLVYDINYIKKHYVDLFLLFAIKFGDNTFIMYINDYCINNNFIIDYKKYACYSESSNTYAFLNENKFINLERDAEYYLSN
jgi:hypothetical protein